MQLKTTSFFYQRAFCFYVEIEYPLLEIPLFTFAIHIFMVINSLAKAYILMPSTISVKKILQWFEEGTLSKFKWKKINSFEYTYEELIWFKIIISNANVAKLYTQFDTNISYLFGHIFVAVYDEHFLCCSS